MKNLTKLQKEVSMLSDGEMDAIKQSNLLDVLMEELKYEAFRFNKAADKYEKTAKELIKICTN